MELIDLVIIFLSQRTSLSIPIPDCDSCNPGLLDLFICSDASIYSAMAYPALGNSDLVFVSVSVDLPSNSKRDTQFQRKTYDYSPADWDGLRDHFRGVSWENISKFSAPAPVSPFFEWVQVGIYVYIPHCKNHVKTYLSPWFLAISSAATIHRNYFFWLYQGNESSESKVKFIHASNRCKSVLESSELANTNKQKSPSLSRKLALGTFGELPIVFSTKINLLYLLYCLCCLLHLIKQNSLLKIFSKNSNLDDSAISLSVFPSGTNYLKLLNISVTPKIVEKLITYLDMSGLILIAFHWWS